MCDDVDEQFMREALHEAQYAMDHEEVPVGCVIVNSLNEIVARGSNRTTAERNATRHCEFIAIEKCLEQGIQFDSLSLYVTVEPCIMCAAALRTIGLTRVVYGCANDRFGGCGSIYNADRICPDAYPVLSVKGGILADNAIDMLKKFYDRGNPKAPDAKRQRPLQGR